MISTELKYVLDPRTENTLEYKHLPKSLLDKRKELMLPKNRKYTVEYLLSKIKSYSNGIQSKMEKTRD